MEVKVDSIYQVTEVRLEIDGTKYRTFTGGPYKEDINFSTGIHNLRVVARDEKGKETDRSITIGVGVPWDYTPSPTPTLTPAYTPTP